MSTVCQQRRGAGFSLVELLIAVAILGIGMVMIAAAFPVGLRYHQESVDDTVGGLLARTAASRLTLLRTHNGHNEYYTSESGYRDAWGQLSVVECFATPGSGDDAQVQYLFQRDSGGDPTHDKDTSGGAVLHDAQLGDDIDEWLPRDERVSEADDRFAYHVFYQLMADPSGGSLKRSYVAYIAVQKSAVGSGEPFDERFPPPSSPVSVTSVSGRTVRLSGGFAVRAGARLVDCKTGDWYVVRDVAGADIELTRAPASGFSCHRVRALNDVVSVFAAIVHKQYIK